MTKYVNLFKLDIIFLKCATGKRTALLLEDKYNTYWKKNNDIYPQQIISRQFWLAFQT